MACLDIAMEEVIGLSFYGVSMDPMGVKDEIMYISAYN
jgi:hypothetical protein